MRLALNYWWRRRWRIWSNDFEYGAIIGLADLVDIQPYGREHDMCSRVIELEPEIGDGYLARVIAGLELGMDDNLKSDTNTLLRLWPDDADATAYGSDAYMVLEEFERAKMLLDRLIEHNPEVYGFLIQHGRALFELGEIDRAKAE